MPPLTRPHHSNILTMTLPPRQAKVIAKADVLVVGGGPAGLGAAIGAAAAGAEVILAERYGFLGGNATAALVMPLMSYHTRSQLPSRLVLLHFSPRTTALVALLCLAYWRNWSTVSLREVEPSLPH